MKLRNKRGLFLLAGVAVLCLVAALVAGAFHQNLAFFYSPTQVLGGEAPRDTSIRIGGLVKKGSLARDKDGGAMQFVMTDNEKELVVRYAGDFPKLFKEGKGAVARGKLDGNGIFVASEVLAKHDESYMSVEAAKAVSEAHARALANKTSAESASQTIKP